MLKQYPSSFIEKHFVCSDWPGERSELILMEEQWFDITTAAEQPEAAEALLSSCTEQKTKWTEVRTFRRRVPRDLQLKFLQKRVLKVLTFGSASKFEVICFLICSDHSHKYRVLSQ